VDIVFCSLAIIFGLAGSACIAMALRFALGYRYDEVNGMWYKPTEYQKKMRKIKECDK
jgi:hypothetical protein